MANINYVAAATAVDPGAMFSSLGNIYDYNELYWASTSISESELSAKWVAMEQ